MDPRRVHIQCWMISGWFDCFDDGFPLCGLALEVSFVIYDSQFLFLWPWSIVLTVPWQCHDPKHHGEFLVQRGSVLHLFFCLGIIRFCGLRFLRGLFYQLALIWSGCYDQSSQLLAVSLLMREGWHDNCEGIPTSHVSSSYPQFWMQ